MIEGLWIVQYEGIQGGGGGVVVFVKDRVLGGDTGYVYTGAYELKGTTLRARVKVSNFLPQVQNVLGIQGDFELDMQGSIDGHIIKASASLVHQTAAGIVVKLTKVSDLPE